MNPAGHEVTPPGPIDVVYAVIENLDGRDRIAQVETGRGFIPMVVVEQGDLDVMLGQCQALANSRGRVLRVLRFSRVGVVAHFAPGHMG